MKKIILIIDDEPEIIEVLTEFIHQIGHTSISASNGAEGLEVASQKNPDLIISDINMPKMNGLEMLEKLKASGSNVPVILFTAFSDTQKIRTAWKLGAFDFVEKPIDFSALQKIIDKGLQFGTSFQSQHPANASPASVQPQVSLEITISSDLHEKLKKESSAKGVDLKTLIHSKLNA
jgi:DNA-binding NtrC family response regulator